jgi:hypothetical protein
LSSKEETAAEHLYHRHEINLARYAVTLTQIAGADSVEEQHVADAARLMGISNTEADRERISGRGKAGGSHPCSEYLLNSLDVYLRQQPTIE